MKRLLPENAGAGYHKDSAHKRYLEACTALARVRRLLARVINQQITIAASGAQQVSIG